MQTFNEWLKENFDEELPSGNISMDWFNNRRLPMVVSCANCEETMCLPNTYIDEVGRCFCKNCI